MSNVNFLPALSATVDSVTVDNLPTAVGPLAKAASLSITLATDDPGFVLLGTIDADTSNISTKIDTVATNSTTMAGLLATMDADTGNIATNTGTIVTNTGNIRTDTTAILADTGDIATNTFGIDTSAADLSTKAVQQSLDFGAANAGLRVSALIGNASGIADFGAGNVSSASLRTTPAADSQHLLATRHETNTTPLSVRLSTGSAFYSGPTTAQFPASLGQTTKANSLSVTMASDQLVPVQTIRNAYASTNVTAGAWVELDSSLDAAVKRLIIFDSSGQTLELGTGPGASETRLCIIPPGGLDIDVNIAATTRLAIRAISGTASTGELDINLLG